MSLVKCPECGKANISDSAEQCPECGYPVKQYFIEKEKEEQRQKLAKAFLEKEKIEWNKLLPELKNELLKIKKSAPPNKPAPPNFFKYLFTGDGQLVCWAMLIFIFIGVILVWLEWEFFISLYCIAGGLGIPYLISFLIYGYKSEKEYYHEECIKWEYQTNNWETHIKEQQEKLILEYKKYAHNMAMYGTRKHEYYIQTPKQPETTLKCPVCGSLNIKKISTANRYISVHTVGLASSKIGKQYECKSCHHKW